MSKRHTRPGNSPVTVVARHGRRDVGYRLSLNSAVVMAFRTTSRGNTIVRKERRLPIGRTMATIAVHRGRQMIGRLKR